jgi:hypothetical protein
MACLDVVGGVPIATFVLACAPYWGWNVFSPVLQQQWWRIQLITAGVFDTHVYLHWIAAAAASLPCRESS